MADDELLGLVRQRMADLDAAEANAPDPFAGKGIKIVRVLLEGVNVPEDRFAPVGRDRPPCDLAAVEAAEHQIGVKLPPLLVRLYTEVADGGFGPGDGATPIAQLAELWEEYAVDLIEAEDLDPWPEALVPFCQIDQTLLACVDCSSPDGAVIGFEYDDLDPEAEGALRAALSPMAPSLTDWIERWLRETA
jgi:hypothetical protein